MKFYLASRYGDAGRLREIAGRLEEQGHSVVSRWIFANRRAGRKFEEIPDAEKTEIALDNREDVRRADVLVLFNDHTPGAARGGKHAELGIMLERGDGVWIVGPRGCVFEWLPWVKQFSSVEVMLGRAKTLR